MDPYPPWLQSAWHAGAATREERRRRVKTRSRIGAHANDRTPPSVLATIRPNRKRRPKGKR